MATVVSAEEAVKRIPNGATVVVVPYPSETLYPAFRKVFEATGSPRDLTMVWGAGLGPFNAEPQGMNHFAVPGMLKRVIAGHIGLNHAIVKLIAENAIEAYNFPQGTLCQLYREIGARRPGMITKIGLGTFLDPRVEGGKMNARTRDCEDLIKLIEIEGEEYLLYKSFPCNVALVRGTSADPKGNITLENEALHMELYEGALAARGHGGIVIAQVERLTDIPANPHHVAIPGVMVDYIVVADSREAHPQTLFTEFNPSYCGHELADLSAALPRMPLGPEKVICRRAAMELRPGMVVNLGIGIPMQVAQVAFEENVLDPVTLTTEIGVFGGLPASGKDFGPARNPQAFVSQAEIFDFYDGGGLDLTCVGMAQTDGDGNVNVSKIGPRVIGCGGFVNLTNTAKKLVFCGEFTAAGLEQSIENGRLIIHREGKVRKFIEAVDQITFSGKTARANARNVLYVTERCVFKLVEEGVLLAEVAPGVDIQKDILGQMGFAPIVPDHVPLMNPAIFEEPPMCRAMAG